MENNWKFYKDTKYLVSSQGLVKNCEKQNLLRPRLDRYGYPKLTIRHDGKRLYKTVHRLVAETWIPNVNDLPQVNHIDGNKTNASHTNLEWVSPSDNIRHSYQTGLNPNSIPVKLTDVVNGEISFYKSIKEISQKLKIFMSVLVPLIKHSNIRPILDRYTIEVLDESKMFDISNTANFGKSIYIHDCLTNVTTCYPSTLIASYHTGLRHLGNLTGMQGCDYKAGYYVSFEHDTLLTSVGKSHEDITEERKTYILRDYCPNKFRYTLLNYYSGKELTFDKLENVVDYLNSTEPIERQITKMLVSYVLFETGKTGKNGLIKGHGIKTSKHLSNWYNYTEEAILSNAHGYPAPVRVYRVKTKEFDKIVFKMDNLLKMFDICHWVNIKSKTEIDVLKFLNIPNLSIERLNKPVKVS
jgi:hypothetical protein